MKHEIPIWERIFCNRSLNLKSIRAIGFDMDYTIAVYIRESFEGIAYTETLKKLVGLLDYPKEILNWKFDVNFMIRGLIVDKQRGNILKMDRHRYVKVAFHGFRELSSKERKEIYDVAHVFRYEEPEYALIDTIFALPEAYLFAQLIDYKDSRDGTGFFLKKSYMEIHQEIRKCIDLCHQDGSIKSKIFDAPEKYIAKDNFLSHVLKRIKDSGRKTFIVTNSHWEHTNNVMSYLLNDSFDTNTGVEDGAETADSSITNLKKFKELKEQKNLTTTSMETETSTHKKNNWLDYFDAVVINSKKPSFFNEINPFDETEETPPNVYIGGHVKLLHDILSIEKGSEILYVGDHIYGDILRSKKEIGWRTMLVVEELESEIKNMISRKREYENYHHLHFERESLEDRLENEKLFQQNETQTYWGQVISHNSESAEQILAQLKAREKGLLRSYHMHYHKIWGQLMKVGRQNSRFSAQVENYACLYTSSLTNLRYYGMNKNFRAVRDYMQHDIDVIHNAQGFD